MVKNLFKTTVTIPSNDFKVISSYMDNMALLQNVPIDFLFKIFRYKLPERDRLYNEVVRKIASYRVVKLESPVTEKDFYKEVKIINMNKLLFDIVYRFSNSLKDKLSNSIKGVIVDAEFLKVENDDYVYSVVYRKVSNGKQ